MVAMIRKVILFINAVNKQALIGYVLLFLSFFVGLLNIQTGIFVDEEDNLLMGSLMLRGFLPYRDIFSHHFPFAYFWMVVVYLFSNESILLARLSVLVFQILIFYVSMRLSSNYIIVGMVSLVWSLIRTYYWGNMILYHSLAAPVSASVFLVAYFIVSKHIVPTKKHAVFIAVMSAALFLLTPLTIYSLIFVFLFIFITNRKFFFQILIILVVVFSLFVCYLIISGSLSDFIDQAILFNLKVYNKYNSFYRSKTEEGLLALAQSVYGVLDVGNKVWFNFDLFKPLVLDYRDIDRWIFTGFHYRFAWIGLFIYLLFNRKFAAAIFSLFFGASLLSVGEGGFHGQPFVLTSIFVSSLTIFLSLKNNLHKSSIKKIIIWMLGWVLLFFMSWLNFRLILSLNNPLTFMSYREGYKVHNEIANRIKKWSCDRNDVRLIYYPAGYRQHFFTRLLPLTKYTAMYPWTAEVGQDEVIQALRNEDALVIVYIEPIDIWGIKVVDYLSPMIDFVKEEFVQVDDWVFVSPSLYSFCPVPVQVNDVMNNENREIK